MTDDRHFEPFDDELLSAYVDGELSGEELASVEQHLADNPQAQQLVAELRALSKTVQSLPKMAVGDDLREAVLQRAEKAMLLGTQEATTLPAHETSESRRWIWATAAIAACLLLMLYQPDSVEDQQPLAKADADVEKQPRAIPQLRAADPNDTASDEELLALDAQADRAAESELAPEPSAPPGVLASAPVADEMVATNELERRELGARDLAMAKVASDVNVSNATPFACQVVLTCPNPTESAERLKQLVAEEGVTVEADKSKSDNSPNAQFADNALATEALAGEKLLAEDSPPTPARATQPTARVVVEATVEQFEQILAKCNDDPQQWTTVRLLAENDQTIFPLQKWRQWERGREQRPQSRQRAFALDSAPPGDTQRRSVAPLGANQSGKEEGASLPGDQGAAKPQHRAALSAKAAEPASVRILFVLEQPTATRTANPLTIPAQPAEP